MNTRSLPTILSRGELIESLKLNQQPKGDFRNYEPNSLSSSEFGAVVGVGSLEQSAGRVELVLRYAVLVWFWPYGPTFYRLVTRTRSLREWRPFRGRC